ncbi:tigger transposable element-derived protein 1-like [Bombina bombina]|uniref:tigger transposable element-derived protein 1-like n=1 Tax=Bombina bombina TaxID=8345 RepID=UPI00235AB32D|nr:tigger transposable element-derived protein 1-like [Bombina bombina]
MALAPGDEKKRIRKPLTLNQKLEMIKMSEQGMSISDIGRKLGLARTTVSTVVNAKEKYLKEVKSATLVHTKVIRKRDNLIAEMEKLLVVWIEDQTSHNVPLSQAIIQSKALSLFNAMKTDRGESAKDENFEASRGWFNRFKERSHLHNIKVQGEAASADVESAEAFPEELAKIIEDGGYTTQQIFNVDETGLFWKKMPSRTFIAKEEKLMPGFKAAKDRLTLLLGANAAGDLKLKPMMIYHSENPRALKNYAKSSLPVYYKSNTKAWMTASLFTTWFTDYFKPTVEAYCKEKKIPFKILMLTDNAPSHPRALMEMYNEIQVVFLPANTTSILQPMDQGVIATFKAYYLKKTFTAAITALDSDASDGATQNKLKAFWKGFTILDAIKAIRDSWNEVSESALRRVWKKLIPTFMDDVPGLETSVEEVNASVVDMARQLELEVEPEDVTELLASHDQPLTDEDLIMIEEQRRLFLETDGSTYEDPVCIREMPTKELEEYVNLIETGLAGLEQIDGNFERSSSVNKIVSNGIACYKEILRERKRQSMKQTSLLSYFNKVPQPSSSPSTSRPDESLSSSPPSKLICIENSDDES